MLRKSSGDAMRHSAAAIARSIFLAPAAAIALMIGLAPAVRGVAAQAAPPTPAAPATGPVAAPAPSVPPPADSPAAGADAAARHAKRTACLKEAKAKKLLGAERTAYVKNCVGGY